MPDPRPNHPALDLVIAALSRVEIEVVAQQREGQAHVLACQGAGTDGEWTVWLAPADGTSRAFVSGDGFLLGYRGEAPKALYEALKSAGARLRALERAGDSTAWFAIDDPMVVLQEPTLIYGDTRLEMRVTLRCNEKCLFCNSVELAENLVPDREGALALLEEARRHGAELLVLTGGEPLLVPWLPDVANRARDLGYRRVTIQSNGVLLDQDAVWQRLTDAAPDEVLISVHGSNDDVVAAVSGVSGLFARKLTAIERCVDAGYRVAVSFVLCRQNMAHARQTMEALAALNRPPRMVAFSFVAPSGSAAKAGKQTIPTMTEAAPHLLAGLEAARRLGLDPVLVEYCGMPTCIEPRLREFAEPFDPDNPLGVPPDKTKVAICDRCDWSHRCSGIFRGYLDLYGDEEIITAPDDHRRVIKP